MKKILFSLLITAVWLSPAVTVRAENVLHVKAGQTHVLAANKFMQLDRLILDDGATLQIPATLDALQLNAARVEIGTGVTILARGEAGTAGVAGASQPGQAAECEAALPGAAGSAGLAGGKGVDLNLAWGIARLGSLTIDTSGGAGGNGGAGGKGQAAGEFDRCRAPAAGAGGDGGAGGNGGAAGKLMLVYRLLPGSKIQPPLDSHLTLRSEGGVAGQGGAGGLGGAGTEGKYITTRSMSGNRKWMGGADTGVTGSIGQAGLEGSSGQILVQQDSRDQIDAIGQQAVVKAPATEPNLNALVQRQERQIQELSTKLDQLTQQMNDLKSRVDQLGKAR